MGTIILIIYAAIQIFTAIQFNQIAVMKGHTSSAYLWFPLLCGPAGWFMVAALPDRAGQQSQTPTKMPKLTATETPKMNANELPSLNTTELPKL